MTHFALSDDQVMDLVERSMVIEQKNAHARMKRGLGSLATVASTASFVGLLGTAIGIIDSFGGGAMQKEALMGARGRRHFGIARYNGARLVGRCSRRMGLQPFQQ